MAGKIAIESKNIKRFYVPRICVIYFDETDLNLFSNLSKLVVEYTKFIQIGTRKKESDANLKEYNRLDEKFYSWTITNNKGDQQIVSPSVFFKRVAPELRESLKTYDIAILVYKKNQSNSLEYIKELVDLLSYNDVFTFHFPIESFISSEKEDKLYKKLVTNFTKKRQVYVPISEASVVRAYKNANVANRNYFINLYVNDMLESFISPFLDPIRNKDHFSIVKATFYQSQRNFDSKVYTSIGYSDSEYDYIDLALIQALSNPIFCAAFDASNTFIVNVKMPFIDPGMLERIQHILKSVAGDWKQFIISSYIGSYDYDTYCQISIMAINVDETKLITNEEKIQEYVKNLVSKVSETNELFDNKTKEIILKDTIEILDDK